MLVSGSRSAETKLLSLLSFSFLLSFDICLFPSTDIYGMVHNSSCLDDWDFGHLIPFAFSFPYSPTSMLVPEHSYFCLLLLVSDYELSFPKPQVLFESSYLRNQWGQGNKNQCLHKCLLDFSLSSFRSCRNLPDAPPRCGENQVRFCMNKFY